MGRMAKNYDCGASVFIGILQSSIMALSKKIIRNIIKMKLVDLKEGEKGFISVVGGSAAFRLRLEEMGFIPGQEITMRYASPCSSTIVFSMLGQSVALRSSEAEFISIESSEAEALKLAVNTSVPVIEENVNVVPQRAATCDKSACAGCPGCGGGGKITPAEKDEITIILVGNPNCGKTAFFNYASGGHERTGNYAGVTVSSVVGRTQFEGKKLRIIDMPGTYSLRAFSPEEAFVANELGKGEADVIVNVLDVNNLERNLLLTLQLMRFGIPVVGVLNIYDEFESNGSEVNIEQLQERLGIPLIPTVACKGKGVDEVLRRAIACAEHKEDCVTSLPVDDVTMQNQHTAVHRILDGVYKLREGRSSRVTALIDRWVASSALGYFAFFALMYLMFYATFEIGAYPMEWMDAGVAWVSEILGANLADGWFKDLLVDGIVGGIGSVIIFLPNILILYFFISILEDTGYLARAAMLADPLLRRVGLHGKSFIPIIMGFGCSVPAVMATRTIESRKSRIITMITLPFMSCSARLPVYTVLAGAFFPENASLVMMGLYFGGVIIAIMSAMLLNVAFRRKEESHFVMEMPPYRMPVMRSVTRHTWEKGRQYIRKMGGIILVASIVIWALGYFSVSGSAEEITSSQQQEQSYLGQIGHAIEPVISPLGYDWRMGVGILAGLGAKELMVSTLGVLYDLPDDCAEDETMLQQAIGLSGMTAAAALSYMVFALLYFPCLATIAAIKGESGRWKYALFTALYTTLVAYIAAWIVYRVAMLF